MIAATADAVRRPARRRRRRRPGSPTPSSCEQARTFGAALVASGVEPATGSPSGRPTAPSGSWPCSGSSRPARCSCRSTPGSRAREAADILARSGARVLVTVTDFLGTDYVAMLDATGVELPVARRRSWSRTARRPRHRVLGRVPRAGDRTDARAEVDRRAAAVGPDDPSDILFTSGHHRRAEGRRADPRPHAAGGHRLGGDDRPHRRRPLPDGQPVLPHVRAQGGHPGLASPPARRCSPSRSSTSTARWLGWQSRAGHRAARRARRSTRRSSTIPTATATTCRACGSR